MEINLVWVNGVKCQGMKRTDEFHKWFMVIFKVLGLEANALLYVLSQVRMETWPQSHHETLKSLICTESPV